MFSVDVSSWLAADEGVVSVADVVTGTVALASDVALLEASAAPISKVPGSSEATSLSAVEVEVESKELVLLPIAAEVLGSEVVASKAVVPCVVVAASEALAATPLDTTVL